MSDWYEYAVTTRAGAGPLSRPEGEGWELVGSTSTPLPAAASGPSTAPRAEHHAWWKRRRAQEPRQHAPIGQSRAPEPPAKQAQAPLPSGVRDPRRA